MQQAKVKKTKVKIDWAKKPGAKEIIKYFAKKYGLWRAHGFDYLEVFQKHKLTKENDTMTPQEIIEIRDLFITLAKQGNISAFIHIMRKKWTPSVDLFVPTAESQPSVPLSKILMDIAQASMRAGELSELEKFSCPGGENTRPSTGYAPKQQVDIVGAAMVYLLLSQYDQFEFLIDKLKKHQVTDVNNIAIAIVMEAIKLGYFTASYGEYTHGVYLDSVKLALKRISFSLKLLGKKEYIECAFSYAGIERGSEEWGGYGW